MTVQFIGDGNPDGTILQNLEAIRGDAAERRGGVLTTPPTATGTTTLTAAQMTGGVLVATPAAIATYTTLTGTLLEAALHDDIDDDDTFDLCIINLGGAGDIITLAGGTDVSIIGSATVDDAGADINSSGVFRFRRTTDNTFVAYRIA